MAGMQPSHYPNPPCDALSSVLIMYGGGGGALHSLESENPLKKFRLAARNQ
jgi:hypothetical protein